MSLQVEARVPRRGWGLGRAEILRLGGGGRDEKESSPSSFFEEPILSQKAIVSFSYEL